MRATVLKLTGAAAVALALASCASKPTPVAAPTPFTLPSATTALAPAMYMQLASSLSLFSIRASEIAEQRSSSREVRVAASEVIRDQGGVGSQLSFAGRRLDLLPSATLTDRQAADLDRLRQSSDFDRDYRVLVGDALATALKAHRDFATAGSSPTLRPVADMAAPLTKRNLDAVRR